MAAHCASVGLSVFLKLDSEDGIWHGTETYLGDQRERWKGGGELVEWRHLCPWRGMAVREVGPAGPWWEDSQEVRAGDPRGWKPGRR